MPEEVVVPIARPKLPHARDVLPYLEMMDARRIYTNSGPLVRALEQRYAAYLGVDASNVVAVASGTIGLTAAATALRPRRWVVPAWTFAATPLAIVQAGKDLQFSDVDSRSGLIDWPPPDSMDSEYGLVIVLPFGSFAVRAAIAEAPNVIVDAAASIANARGRLGGLHPSSTVVFSLHATKILGCGEGGLVICGSTALADQVRSVINFGFGAHRTSQTLGMNGKLPEMSAAYALAALDREDYSLRAWSINNLRAREISAAAGASILCPIEDQISPYWILDLREAAVALEHVERHFLKNGVETRRWWPAACTEMPAFRSRGIATPHSSLLSRRTVGLPMREDMCEDDFELIWSALSTLKL